ncbi:hypothetical protein [Hymenobacter sp. BT559]|uniref:hypothetical protein n=1 Tax=Hymenobacter sp. BT559 TaxID=2795729 RepID=UPI0018ED6E65|nr:hypothetical protein [Hymenobacter sp. BT559]MBJ6141806.1 hypothetical protein [Hymenobacter sp. BT559]
MPCAPLLSPIINGSLVGPVLAGLALVLLFPAAGLLLLRGGIRLLRDGHKGTGTLALMMGLGFLLFICWFLKEFLR